MNRRGFFGRMIGAVVAAKIAPQLIETLSAKPLSETDDYTVKYVQTYPAGTMTTATINSNGAIYILTAEGPYVNDGLGSVWKRL